MMMFSFYFCDITGPALTCAGFIGGRSWDVVGNYFFKITPSRAAH